MPNPQQDPLTPKKLAKLAKQLDPKCQLRLIKELAGILSPHLLEAMKTEAEQEWILRQLEGIEEPEELDEFPARHFEFKEIKHKHYAYLRWREDRRHKSQYLGPMPFLPGHTYTLTHKKTGNKETFTPLGLEVENDQIYLNVQVLNPIHTIQSYLYPECLNTIFSKKEWSIQKVASPHIEKKEVFNTNPFGPQAAFTPPIKPEVRNAGEAEPRPGTLKPEKAEPLQARTTRKSRSKLIRIADSENLKDKRTPILEVPNKLVPQVYATLKLWENLSQSLGTTPQWTLLDKGNKVTLRATQENKTIMEYNRALGSVTSPRPAPVLIEWLQQIANAVSSSPLVDQDTKTQALRLKTRLQGAHKDNSAVLLAYLLGLPAPKKRTSDFPNA